MPLLTMVEAAAKEVGTAIKNKGVQAAVKEAGAAAASALAKGAKTVNAEAGVLLAQVEKPGMWKQAGKPGLWDMITTKLTGKYIEMADKFKGTPSTFMSTGGKGIIQQIDPSGTLVRVSTVKAGNKMKETVELLRKGYNYTPETLEKFATRNNSWKNYVKEWKQDVPFLDRWLGGAIPVYTQKNKILERQAEAIIKNLSHEPQLISHETAKALAQHGFIDLAAPAAKLAAVAEPAATEAVTVVKGVEKSAPGFFESLVKNRKLAAPKLGLAA